MDWVNDNTEPLRDVMVDAGIPDFNVGINSAGDTYHEIAGYRVDHDQARVDRAIESNVNAAITKVRQDYGAAWRESSNGVFGTNYELGPIGIGINLELALPEWLPFATHNTGFSLSFGLVADSKDNIDFYVTEGTPTKNNVAFSVSPEIFYVESRSRQVYNKDIEGFSNQFSLGIGILGGSVSSNPSISYRQWTLTGLGSGIDVNTGSWETYTRLYKIYGR